MLISLRLKNKGGQTLSRENSKSYAELVLLDGQSTFSLEPPEVGAEV